MWKKPEWVTGYFAEAVWNMAAPALPLRTIIPNLDSEPDEIDAEPLALLLKWTDDISALLLQSSKPTDAYEGSPIPVSFQRSFHDYIIREAMEIEKRRRYDLAHKTGSVSSNLAVATMENELPAPEGAVALLLSDCIMVLMASERRMLVGINHGVPIWKPINRVQNREDAYDFCRYGAQVSRAWIQQVGADDVWLIPDFREWDATQVSSQVYESDYGDINAGLIEAAFYNQRYIVDPEGAHVRVTSAGPIKEVFLKVKGGNRGSLVDILARLKTESGDYFMVLTEERILSADVKYNGSYASYVVCQVYHDLVTAEEITIFKETREGQTPAGPIGDPTKPSLTWIAIPRRIKNILHPPRIPVPTPKVMAPHRVTGHLRKGHMTLGHREELVKFERDTGLQVLRFVPEGYTFVRPHISPKSDSEDFLTLPRFIRYRVQQALEKAISSRDLKT